MTEVTSSPKVRLAVAAFAVLVAGALAGDYLNWFDTPLGLGNQNAAARAAERRVIGDAERSCRFAVALARAGAKGRVRMDAEKLTSAYMQTVENLDKRQKRAVQAACLRGIRDGLKASRNEK